MADFRPQWAQPLHLFFFRMRTRSAVAREKAASATRAREIGRLETEIRMQREKIDEVNTIWLKLVEKEARGVVKARYFGKIASVQASILELEWRAVKYHGSISEFQKELQALRSAY